VPVEAQVLSLGGPTISRVPTQVTVRKRPGDRESQQAAWAPEAFLRREVSDRSERVGARIAEGDADPVVPFQVNADVPSAETAATLTVAGDRLEESEPPEAEKAAPKGRGTVPEVKPGVDDPDAILAEAGLDGDRERRGVLLGGHEATFPPSGPVSQDGGRSVQAPGNETGAAWAAEIPFDDQVGCRSGLGNMSWFQRPTICALSLLRRARSMPLRRNKS
jgi:hypothetical protein